MLLVHPAKQHAYEVALALQKAGQLREFATGAYYVPGRFPYTLVHCAPERLRARALRALQKRREPALSPELVRTWPYGEIISRLVSRLPGVHRLSRGRSGYPLVNWTTDLYVSRRLARMRPQPKVVFGFLGGVLRTFRRARRLGIPTILDVPIVFDAAEIVNKEYQTLGLTRPVAPPPSRRLQRELAAADWIVAPSSAVAESVRRAGFVGRGVVVVPFGADTSLFRPAGRTDDGGRPFRAVFAGRLEVRKGLHYLLEAWSDAGLHGELVLAGSEGEEEFVARMRRQYRGLFTEAGNLTQAELAELFAAADVFVFPSLAEGSALVTYQALAAGLPCIVTPEAGSVVRDGIEGFIVPARDSGAIADRLKTLYGDRDLRDRMRRAAVERGREFAWNRYHDTIAAFVSDVQHQGAALTC